MFLLNSMSELEINKIPLKILIPYRTLSVIFGVAALLNLLAVLSFSLRQFFVFALIHTAYAALSGILACGFWKMKKWIVSFLGSAVVVVTILNIVNVIRGTQNISQALVGFVILGALFLFTYLSRNFLDGEYKNLKALGLFLALIIFIQAATFFLK